MKRCPHCNRTYWNDDFAFCLDDGTLLSPPYDSNQTLVLRSLNGTDLPPTLMSASNVRPDDVATEKEIPLPKPTGKRRRWTYNSFLEDAMINLKLDEIRKLKQLYEFSIKCADRIKWGSGIQKGSFSVVFDSLSISKSLYTVYSDGFLDLNFRWLPDDEKALVIVDEFAQSLKSLRGFGISGDFRSRSIGVGKEHWMPQINDFTQAVLAIALSPSNS